MIREIAMQPLFLFGLASRHAQWASVRQAAISGNIANANTPGYKAVDVEPFTAVLDKTRLSMARTAEGHMAPPSATASAEKMRAGDGWDLTVSGNSVSIEEQMLKADEVNRAYALNTSVVRSFHRMLLASVK
jgi:flagellar basal-body rod protein FlgB